MQWYPFVYNQKTYDLRHLHRRELIYAPPVKDGKTPLRYKTEVIFSMHCFTRGLKRGECPEPKLLYSDERETRVFDFHRFELSHNLPAIIEQLLDHKCFHTGAGNFFTVKLVDSRGEAVEYEIFFKAYKAAKKGLITLFIESAYVRDWEHSTRPHAKAVAFKVILFNTLNNKPLHAGQ